MRPAQRVFIADIAQHDSHDIGIGLGKVARAGVLHIVAPPDDFLNLCRFLFGYLGQVAVDNVGNRHDAYVGLARDVLKRNHSHPPHKGL